MINNLKKKQELTLKDTSKHALPFSFNPEKSIGEIKEKIASDFLSAR